MPRRDFTDGAYPVPSRRLARMARLGGMTTGVLSNMLTSGARQIARGERPRLPDMLLNPATARRLTRDLGQMRGAAMKLGQMLSMDAGVVLPPEMTDILSALRSDAPHMPPAQLRDVLDAEWGSGWYGRFDRFDVRPFAAASIGQVHRARMPDGRDLAIKVQYPGVRDSIDSDLDNAAALLRLPGLIPRDMDLSPVLREAKRQLHIEADYLSEGRNLMAFHGLLGDTDAFLLPEVQADLSTPQVLAMTYLECQPLEALTDAPQALRDRVAGDLIELVLRELFAFRLMQTDPNLANYRFDPATGRIVLLDFGAVMPIAPELSAAFRRLLNAALEDDPDAIRAEMQEIGYFSEETAPRHIALCIEMFRTAMAPLRQSAPFDFGHSDLLDVLHGMGHAMGRDRDMTHVPPPETLFLHRKIGGIYLLAAKLRARVALRPMVERFR
ncbi:ABC1 kinase family protein [Amaricoccus macauensis]|uniref:ABC1 kinase family protein n=1 Tax=Amaricoccus macauensis TaxID=57001 RepID=UPI003C7CF2EA